MSGQITITFSGFTDENVSLNIPRAKKGKLPPPKRPTSTEENLLKNALGGYALLSPRRGPLIRDLLKLLVPPLAAVKILGSVGSIPIRSPIPDFTVALGGVASVGAGISAGIGGGVYFWNKRPRGEVGFYGSISLGYITNIGMSAGDSLAILFGTAPSVLAGDIIALEVDVDIPPATVGGQIFITAPPVSLSPPALTGAWTPEIVGIGYVLTMGISMLPLNIAVTPSRTWIKPITP